MCDTTIYLRQISFVFSFQCINLRIFLTSNRQIYGFYCIHRNIRRRRRCWIRPCFMMNLTDLCESIERVGNLIFSANTSMPVSVHPCEIHSSSRWSYDQKTFVVPFPMVEVLIPYRISTAWCCLFLFQQRQTQINRFPYVRREMKWLVLFLGIELHAAHHCRRLHRMIKFILLLAKAFKWLNKPN